MSATSAVIHLDLVTVHPYRRQYLILIAVGLVITISLPDPSVALPSAAVYAALAAAYPFAIGDKADLSTLLGALPVRRISVVLGRYAFATLTFGVAVSIAIVAMIAVSAARSLPVEPLTALTLLAISFALFALTVGIQFPMYFTMGYTRARMLAYLPFAAIVLATVVGAPLLPQDGTEAAPAPALAIAVTAAGLVMLAASAWTSCRLFSRRAL
jgi:ABC-type transport system involved in multi-copper enzyme maturation permease subunit